jgi:seryl-tRNA synthetase
MFIGVVRKENMLDIKFIRDNSDIVKKAIVDKRIDLNLDELLDLDRKRRDLLAETESLQATKNQVSKEIPKLEPEARKVKILEMQEVDARQTELEPVLRTVQAAFDHLMYLVPNIPAPEAPIGPDESANVPWSYWSPSLGHVDPKDEAKVAQVPTNLGFEPKDHIELATKLNLLDLERGVEVSGFRGYYLKNEAVLMHYGLLMSALTKMQSKGFTLFAPPTLVRDFPLFGSGHFPAGYDEVYHIANVSEGNTNSEKKDELHLAGTSEASLLAYYANRTLDEKDLPLKLAGIGPCYRSEVGSYGKDTKGIYRIHEFMKVEQVVICKADLIESEQWLEALRQTAEEMLQELQLPYRVLNICTGDMGAGKYKMYDLETWMPARGKYGETHSDSNLTDWQARRLNIKYKATDGTTKYAFTLNNTAIASPRILIAILENYQQADGSVKVPEILQKYVGRPVLAAI